MSLSVLFKTFDDVEKHVNELRAKYNPIRVFSSQTAESYNSKTKSTKNHVPLTAKFYRISYVCKHFGAPRSRGRSLRQSKNVMPSDCKFHITFKYNVHLKAFVITSKDDNHNHVIGRHIYSHYAANRKLPPEISAQVIDMLNAGTKPSVIRDIIQEKTSKFVLTKDIHNIKHKYCSPKNEVAELSKIGGELLAKDSESEFILVLNENEEYLDMIFVQTSYQKQIYRRFGETLQLNVTYKAVNTLMPLFDFAVEDNNGKSIVVAYCFVSSGSTELISMMLQIFKNANQEWGNTKVILIDEDFVEIDAVKNSFPSSKILLCLFHMIKTISTKLSSIKDAPKDEILSTCKSLIYASTEDEFNSRLSTLQAQSEEFFKYFSDNWIPNMETWCKIFQKNEFTLRNTMTNRMEANHRILKERLSTITTLTQAVRFISELNNTSLSEITHNEFKQQFCIKVSKNKHSDIASYFTFCTTYAAELISDEYETSLNKMYTVLNSDHDCRLLSTYQTYLFDEGFSRCSCDFNAIMHLPCRHIFYIRRNVDLPVYDECLVSTRFRRTYLTELLKHSEEKGESNENTSPEEVPETMLIVKDKNKILTRQDKYKKAVILTQKIAEAASELSNSEFRKAIKNLELVLHCMQNKGDMTISILYRDDGES